MCVCVSSALCFLTKIGNIIEKSKYLCKQERVLPLTRCIYKNVHKMLSLENGNVKFSVSWPIFRYALWLKFQTLTHVSNNAKKMPCKLHVLTTVLDLTFESILIN